jgi:ABC-type multidrug transport system fused ATPase/permease subunit
LLLGLYEPNEGSITLSGIEPKYAIKAWPGSVSYVPQSVTLINGSIAENVALGYSADELDKTKVLQCLQTAQLDEYISTLPDGIDTIVGEAASRMSGGQLQRLGIARAIYTDPKLLVLDEATSALDGKTESEVSEAIIALKGKITVVLIAHRLSTVLKADRLAYLESGRLLSVGTFEHVKSQIPELVFTSKVSETSSIFGSSFTSSTTGVEIVFSKEEVDHFNQSGILSSSVFGSSVFGETSANTSFFSSVFGINGFGSSFTS